MLTVSVDGRSVDSLQLCVFVRMRRDEKYSDLRGRMRTLRRR